MDPVRRAVEELSPAELSEALAQIEALDPIKPNAIDPGPMFPPRNPEIRVPDPPDQAAALTLRIEVDEIRPTIWRQVVVRGDLTLESFHEVIQHAIGWQNYHLHRFWSGDGPEVWRSPYFVTDGDLEEGEEGTHEADVRLDQVLRAVGDRLRYTYDFGDDWFHTITLESVDVLDPEAPVAVCTAGEMAGPLEDSGGTSGYTALIEAFAADPPLSGLEDYVREWLPQSWDPTALDLHRVNAALALAGATPRELFAAAASTADVQVDLPEALTPLLDLAPPNVLADVAALCHRAASSKPALTEADLAAIARPYRFLIDLAGADGIPLTQAGWMKPAVVQEIYTGLGFDDVWYGKGNREDQTLPVAELRERAQDLGLLRKFKGRLLRTRKAERLHSDRDYVEFVAAGLLRHKDPYVTLARGLFALLSVVSEHSDLDLGEPVAELLTRCGLRTGPSGVERQHAVDMVWPTWYALEGQVPRRNRPPRADLQAVGLAAAALWPDRVRVSGVA